MGCSHSKRRQFPAKKKVASMGILMNFQQQRPSNPNKQIDEINTEIRKSPFPQIKPSQKTYQSRMQKSYISSVSAY